MGFVLLSYKYHVKMEITELGCFYPSVYTTVYPILKMHQFYVDEIKIIINHGKKYIIHSISEGEDIIVTLITQRPKSHTSLK